MLKNNIAIYSTSYDLKKVGEALSEELSLPFVSDQQHDFKYLLTISHENVAITLKDSPKTPIMVDFLTKQFLYRLKNLSIKKELLARALGLKKSMALKIIDATAGFANDSFILASLGFKVTLLERSHIVHTLLKDGIQRALKNPLTQDFAKNLTLIRADSTDWLCQQKDKPDIIYIDPMFPDKKKSAKPKQNMQVFQNILGSDLDSENLLKVALACAKKRVVVKRPKLGAPIDGNIKPSFYLKGSSCRFDIYLIMEQYGNF